MNIFRFGNEFWIEGDWHAAATVEAKQNLREPDAPVEFAVSYGSGSSDSPEAIKPYGSAIVSACEYAVLCRELFKGKTRAEVLRVWADEICEEGLAKIKEWADARKAAKRKG